ncbi:MAG TPA: OmpA family protein [Candidatus Sulfotelmatobacter sp.]|nr:OmpA family protein [Candidatus Sulfotelmatobacter sp.]
MTRSYSPQLFLVLLSALLLPAASMAQDSAQPSPGQQNPAPPLYPNPASPAEQQSQQKAADESGQMPIFRVNVYARNARAVNYRNRGGSTTVDIKGTDLEPGISGKAKVDGKAGRLAIDVELNHMQPPTKFGGQYLTYVLWAVTPEGRAVNLGEILPGGNGKDKIDVTTDLQAFGLIVTAEPYFSVTHPSNEVVAENEILPQTKGFQESIDAKFDVLEGREYTIDVPADQLPSAQASPNVPLDLLEARNAVVIAKAAGAEKYASDSIQKAEDMLQRAENYYERKQGRTPIGTAARGATQMAEDARVLALRREADAREEAARQAAAAAQAKAEADAQAAQQQAQQAQAQSDEDARRRAAAEEAQAQADLQRAQALQQQQQAQAQAAAAQAQAAAAQQAEAQAIQQKEQMRARLLAQLNQVLQTRDTAQGLIVSMPDVLFDFNKYTLKPEARERLAKISGIVLAYPDLKLQVEGFTDSIGSDEYNLELSEKRADSVRAYLISNGVSPDHVTAQGFGKSNPVADNDTAEGRKLNRRVDMIVSGDVIGSPVGSQPGQPQQQPTSTPYSDQATPPNP